MVQLDPRLTLITLGVSDLEKSKVFYSEIVGFPISAHSVGNIVFFELRGIWLALYPRKELAKDIGISAEGKGFQGFTISHNLKSKEAVDTFFEQLIHNKVTIPKMPVEADWGGYTGYFKDPDGYVWEIAWNPSPFFLM